MACILGVLYVDNIILLLATVDGLQKMCDVCHIAAKTAADLITYFQLWCWD